MHIDISTIREPVESDIPQIARLLAELGYPAEESFVGQQLQALADGGADWMFVAARGEVLVGLVSYHQFLFYHMPGIFGRITTLVVDGQYRRQGIGKRLVAFIEQFAREQGCTRMELNSAFRRTEAHAFYESLGYESDSKRFIKPLV